MEEELFFAGCCGDRDGESRLSTETFVLRLSLLSSLFEKKPMCVFSIYEIGKLSRGLSSP